MACPGLNPADEYSVEHIQVLTGLEAVRHRPVMYIGSTGARGLSHLLFELVSDSLTETVNGYGRSVRVALRADGSAEVADDGRALPTHDPPRGAPTVEQLFTEFCYGKVDSVPPARGNLHHTVTSAVSEWLRVAVRNDGRVSQHTFRRGVADAAVQSAGPAGDRGLTITFRPDPLIFGPAQFDADAIRARLRWFAFAHSGIRITFFDETTGARDEFEYADGIRECVRALNTDRSPLHPDAILLRGEVEDVRYEVGLQWCANDEEAWMSFANGSPTPTGGTHTNGVRSGVIRGMHDFICEHALQSGEFRGDDLRAGLTAVVSVWLSDPCFEGMLGTRLGNPEVEGIVSHAVQSGVRAYFESNRDAAERVVGAVVAARDARVAARAIRQKQRQARSGE
jgi:DNA gyrase subunit B